MALNRVALAAALLEYDNDNPSSGLAPRKAHESAILRGARRPVSYVPPETTRDRQRGWDGAREDERRWEGADRGEDEPDHRGYPGHPTTTLRDPGFTEGEPEAGEGDMGEIDLGSWDLPDTFLPRAQPRILNQQPPPHIQHSTHQDPPTNQSPKPALTVLERRAMRKGRTVSFHGFPTTDEGIEQLEEPSRDPHQEREQEPIGRPRSSMSIMSRGRPTSPFNAPSASPTTALPVDIPLPPSPSPYAGPNLENERYTPNEEPNPFALPPPAGPRLSRFDPKITPAPRPTSIASGYFPSQPQTHQQPLSPTRLRPRTIILPTPLHTTTATEPGRWDTASYTHGPKPLPPGALTRPDSFVGRMDDLTVGKPFEKSRELFRRTLDPDSGAGGEGVPKADTEGVIAFRQYGGRDPDPDSADDSDFEIGDEEHADGWRPETRSLTGLSLMDRLEARKAELKSKNRFVPPLPGFAAKIADFVMVVRGDRQFRGDNRPAMMERNSGPLVQLDGSAPTSPRHGTHLRPATASPPRPGMPRGKSVFGVDEIWERDLRKLEAQRAEERVAAAALEEKQRRKGKKKGKRAEEAAHPYQETLAAQGGTEPGDPPNLSLGELSAALIAPKTEEPAAPPPHRNVTVDEWAAVSDEDAPAEPRRRKRRVVKPGPGSDSDDEVPLAKAFGVQRKQVEEEDSSEDEPLSKLKKKVSKATLEPSEDEDDIPLALRRAKKLAPPAPPPVVPETEIDEDDLPLAQRRLRAHAAGGDPGQHMAMAQQQGNMMLNPMSMYGGMPMPMMGMGIGMPMGMGMPSPMGMPMGMGMGMGIPSPLPMGPPGFPASPYPVAPAALDPKIDRWRREVGAREGSVASGPAASVVTSGGRS